MPQKEPEGERLVSEELQELREELKLENVTEQSNMNLDVDVGDVGK